MNQREFLTISVGIFFTIIAWMVIDIYHNQQKRTINQKVTDAETMEFTINDSIFKTLQERSP